MKKKLENREAVMPPVKKVWLVMRLSILLILTSLVCSSVGVYSQNTTFSLKMKNQRIADVFDAIEQQSNFYFFYNREKFDDNRLVSVDFQNKKIDEILQELFKDEPVTYEIVDRNILVKVTTGYLKMTAQQQRTVTGKVTDSSGAPLPGVSVAIKGTTTGTITDADGNYSIPDVRPDAILLFSFVGMKTQEVAVANKATISVVMEEETIGIEEVVAIGYGTAKRKDFPGSVASFKVEGSPVSLLPNTNALETIKGNVAGVDIGAVNEAGGEASILIRGQRSLRGSNDPLIILDGVIYTGSMTDINPYDIEKVDVLKDAVSAAVYGSRSANGVIIITTKKGKTQKPTITVNSSIAFQQFQNKPDLMNPDQWLEKVNDFLRQAEGTTSWMMPQILANYNEGKVTDWLGAVTQTGVIQNYQVAVSGSPNKVNYYLSAAYGDNKGIVVGDDFNRITLIAKIQTDITGWLQIGADANFTKRDYSGIEAKYRNAKYMEPYGVMYRDDQGNLEKYPREQGTAFVNPLWGVSDGLVNDYDVRKDYRLYTYALFTAPWVKGLTYRINLQNSLNTQEARSFTHEGYYVAEGSVTNTSRYEPSTIEGFLTQANGSIYMSNESGYVFDNILNFNHAFDKHNIDATLVATRDYSMSEYKTMNGDGFSAVGNTSLSYWGLHSAANQNLELNVVKRSNIGYLGRLSYSYNDKYYFTGSFRRDGASVFGANRKWGNFSAAGVAWRISNEEFLKNLTPLNYLKLKLSWGQNGNQGVTPYSTLAQVLSGTPSGIRYEFSNTGSQILYGLKQLNMANSALGWETTKKWNGGFESVWLKNRLFVDVDVYLSNTTDQIYTPTIPSMNGFTSITSSLGEVQNYGAELTLKTINIKNRNWNWNTNITWWFNRNKLITLTGDDLDGDGVEDDNIASGMFIGEPINAIYGYVQDGIIQEGDDAYKAMEGAATENGYPKYKDISKDGKISSLDRKIVGYPQEKFRLNMGNTVSYKNLELYVMIAGIFGGGKYYLKSNTGAYTFENGWNANATYRKYWKSDRPSNTYPAAYFGSDGRFQGLQSRSFVRVQNVTLSYELNPGWLKTHNINSLKLFCTANNPLIFTKWVGGDPEIGTPESSSDLPVASTYSFGVNVSF